MGVAEGFSPPIDEILALEDFAADGAVFAESLPIVFLAIGLAILLEVSFLTDQLAAGCATHSEQLIEITFAVGLASALEMTLAGKRPAAMGAGEVLRMPVFAESLGGGSPCDRLATAGATGAEAFMITAFMIRLVGIRLESALFDHAPAAGATKAAGVPRLTEGDDGGAGDSFVAMGADGHGW